MKTSLLHYFIFKQTSTRTATPLAFTLACIFLFAPAPQASGQAEWAGFDALPYNNATIEVDPETGDLVATGGIGGEFGVEFTVPQSTGFEVNINPEGDLRLGEVMRACATGDVAGENVDIAVMQLEGLNDAGGEAEYTVAWAEQMAVQEVWLVLYDNNCKPIGQQKIDVDVALLLQGINAPCLNRFRCDPKPGFPGVLGFWNCIESKSPLQITINEITYTGVYKFCLFACPKIPPTCLNSAKFTIENRSSLRLTDAAVQFAEASPFANNIGDTRLIPQKPNIIVGLPEGGEVGGACLLFDAAAAAGMEFGPMETGTPGATATFVGRGSVADNPEGEIGSVTSTDNGDGTFDVDANFDGIGAESFCVVVWLGDDRVLVADGLVDQIGTIGSGCKSVEIQLPGNDNPCIEMVLAAAATVDIPGFGAVTGDRIVIKSKAPAVTVQDVREADIIAADGWSDLTITGAPNTPARDFASGFPLVPLGGAEISENEAGATVVGVPPTATPTPTFGVCFEVERATGFEARVEPMNMPAGGRMDCIARGSLRNNPNQVVVQGTLINADGATGTARADWNPDMAVESQQYVFLNDQGEILSEGTMSAFDDLQLNIPEGLVICRKRVRCDDRLKDGFEWLCFTFYMPIIIVDPNSGIEIGEITEIWLIAEISGPDPELDFLSEYDIVVMDVDDGFVLNNAQVQYAEQGVFVDNLGDARLTADAPAVTISNFGDNDGFQDGGCFVIDDPSTQAEPPTDATLEFDDMTVEPEEGGTMYFRAVGCVEGSEEDVEIGYICTERLNEGKYLMTANFLNIGSTAFNVFLYKEGVQVAMDTCLTDSVGCLWTGCKSAAVTVAEINGTCLVITLPGCFEFELPDGTIWEVDRIVIKPKDPNQTVISIKEVDIFANRDWPPMTIRDVSTAGLIVGVNDAQRIQRSSVFNLHPVYPNPVNQVATIDVNILKPALLDVSIYDIAGNRIATLDRKALNPGEYSFNWDTNTKLGESVGNGTYIVRVQALPFGSGNAVSQSAKMTVMR